MKNYSHHTNKKVTRFRTSSVFKASHSEDNKRMNAHLKTAPR